MNSKIYQGFIEHYRYVPKFHGFRYPIYMYGLFLDELDTLNRRIPLFGYNRLRLSAIHDTDYLSADDGTIREKIAAVLEQQGFDPSSFRIFLVTAARFLNYVFNPVSFYFCLSPENELTCTVVEVNNTYGEKHLYVLDTPRPTADGLATRFSAEKAFHVSPFNDLEGSYEFLFADIRHQLDARITLLRKGEKVLDARLWGKPLDLTVWNHLKTIAKHPITPHLSIPRIYREAFKLYFRKRVAFNRKPAPISKMTIRSAPPTTLERICRHLTISLLNRISKGSLTVRLPDGRRRVFGEPASATTATMEVQGNAFFTRIALNGEIGLGESYMSSEWDSPDLVGLFALFADNRDQLSDGQSITSSISSIIERTRHRNAANTVVGSRRNIARHYDLGNEFYELFLGDTMMYSCAVFGSPGESLDDAQRRKLDMVIEKAGITADLHVLEIGCGWGGFAVAAARSTGCRVTGITVSPAQYRYATDRIVAEGLSDRVTILLRDYRHMEGRFDRIVSIEMLEAVGHENFGAFFRRIDDLLRPEGIAVIQSITIPDRRYATYRKKRDWIQKHIFPGGHLPSIAALTDAMRKHSGLVLEHLEDIGVHYAQTLNNWRERFTNNIGAVKALGFDSTFIRKWIYYFCMCEAGFARRILGDMQMVLARPEKPNSRTPQTPEQPNVFESMKL